MLFTTDQPVIFVEDDEALRAATTQTLQLAGFRVQGFHSADAAIGSITPEFGGAVISDIRMRGMDGLQLFARVREIDDDIPVILVTGHADVAMAVNALRAGAFDFLAKPFATDQLIAATRRALEKRLLVLDNRRLRALAGAEDNFGPLIGDSAAIVHLRATIRQLAALDIDVLIEGETGTGKDLVARTLHRLSPRRNQPFVSVNCGALSDTLIETQLFGHSADGPSGTRTPRFGKLATQRQGFLLLDDIETMPLPIQARLLTALDSRSVDPPSPAQPPIDVRVVATAKVELGSLVDDGQFRSDLYYRLNAVRLRLPPLRERREDIPTLFAVFVAEARAQLGAGEFKLTERHRRTLTSYDWPGNGRELKSYALNSVLGISDAPDGDFKRVRPSLTEQLRQFEAAVIEDALRSTDGNVTAAQAVLKVPRKTLYEKMTRLAIDAARFRKGLR